jgi:8-oxo-dGTP pyrophosphatase MutT (NUDIX family)
VKAFFQLTSRLQPRLKYATARQGATAICPSNRPEFAAMPLALSADDPRRQLLQLLDRYSAAGATAAAAARMFREFGLQHADCFERSCVPGHFTGSAWLVDRTGQRLLLTHHRKLDRWLQLGGHADGDGNLARVALREAKEESGLTGLVVEPEIFDLDRHIIPARGNEPEHWHYDVRFVVRANGSEEFVVGDESHALAWCDIARIASDAEADESLRRMARKWLERR